MTLFGVSEADYVRWVGVAVALAGTVTAAPEGTVRIWRMAINWLRQAFRRVRSVLARFLPLLRQHATVQARSSHAHASAASGWGVAPSPRVRVEHGSLEAQVEYLGTQLQRAFDEIEEVRREAREGDAALRQIVEQHVGELRTADRALREWLEARRNWEVSVDARGVFVIALSVLLWGIPGELAAVPVVGWLFIAAALAATAMIVRRVFADLR